MSPAFFFRIFQPLLSHITTLSSYPLATHINQSDSTALHKLRDLSHNDFSDGAASLLPCDLRRKEIRTAWRYWYAAPWANIGEARTCHSIGDGTKWTMGTDQGVSTVCFANAQWQSSFLTLCLSTWTCTLLCGRWSLTDREQQECNTISRVLCCWRWVWTYQVELWNVCQHFQPLALHIFQRVKLFLKTTIGCFGHSWAMTTQIKYKSLLDLQSPCVILSSLFRRQICSLDFILLGSSDTEGGVYRR